MKRAVKRENLRLPKMEKMEKTGNGHFTFCLSDFELLPNVISLTNVTVEACFAQTTPLVTSPTPAY